MKYFFTILLLTPLFMAAQDCNLIKETDPYTKETKISSGFIALQRASVSIEADNKEIDFFFIIEGKCYNDASTAFIYFEGNRVKATYRNGGGMNCDGYFHIKFRNTPTTQSPVQKLSTQKVTQFIFADTDKKEMIVSLLPEQQKALMEAAACVANEAKTLIK